MKYAALFIALLFAGCGGGYETFTVAGETMQVAKEDFPFVMNWDNAMNDCKELGNGWRLPTKEELVAMHKQLHKQGRGNFKNAWYWSSSQGSGYPWVVTFNDGRVYISNFDYLYKGHFFRVRAVRAF